MSTDTATTAPGRPRGLRARIRTPRAPAPRKGGSALTSGRADVVMLILVLLLPWVVNSDYVTGVTTKYLSFALLAISLDILWGYAGLVSFGQGAIFGVGAYALGITLQHVDGVGGTYLGLLAAVTVCVLLGVAMGWFLFSGREIVGGFGFSIVTLAFGLILSLVATSWEPVTGGSNGLYGYAMPSIGVPGLELSADSVWGAYYVVAILAVVVYALVRWILASDVGLILRASAQNEVRTDAVGHSVARYRTLALGLSAGVAGLAGALYTPAGVVTPSLMTLQFSTLAIIWVALGGRGTLIGPVLGVIALSWGQNYLSGELLTLSTLVTGVLLTLIVLLWPDGLLGGVRTLGRRLRRQR